MKDIIQDRLTQYLSADAAIDKWDEPPNLMLIVQNRDGAITFDQVPIGDAWSAAPPHEVVWAAGKTAQKVHEMTGWSPVRADESLLGITLFSEGWGLSAKASESEALKKWVEAGNHIEDHPDRVEFKMITAVLTDGTTMVLTHNRGGNTEVMDEGAIEGRVPESLRRALSDFQEVSGL